MGVINMIDDRGPKEMKEKKGKRENGVGIRVSVRLPSLCDVSRHIVGVSDCETNDLSREANETINMRGQREVKKRVFQVSEERE